MQSFLTPDKLYFKKGCLPVALRELRDELHAGRVLIVTDEGKQLEPALALVTNILNALGIGYTVNRESFESDAVIGFGYARALERAAALAGERYCIAVPVSAGWELSVPAWRQADMVILDEDVCEPVPEKRMCMHIAQTARASLVGANPSDYTLSLSVQALRILFGSHTAASLLHAAAMAEMAYTAAHSDEYPADALNLFPDAAEALGMTAEELETKINCAVDPAQ
ncbi:MAG: hypothetical protein IJ595_05305 [Oscillospiraceae bacterium]|nr:hypothetical protein [Oscillospiraceae bacterium]